MRTFDKDYYTILGIGKDATTREVTAAFRKLALQFHPDVNPSAEAKEHMPLLNEAYSVLGDEKLRSHYDTALIPTTTTATLAIYRTGASVGVGRGLDLILDGAVIGQILMGTTKPFLIEPGAHRLQVKLDLTSSPVHRFSCEAGMTVGFACGARSVMEYVFQSIAQPKNAFFIHRVA